MKSQKLRNHAHPISTSRWLAYATAGAATAFGCASAEADIHYSGPVNLKLQGHPFYRFATLPLSGGADLRFLRTFSFEEQAEAGWIEVRDANIAGVRGTSYFASKLYRGDTVSVGPFASRTDQVALNLINIYGSGNFAERGVGFAGFKFDVGNGAQYGWARIRTVRGGRKNAIEVVDYAWGDPGDKIRAGQTTSRPRQGDTAAASLGFLALGSAGLVAWRKRRSRGQARAE